MTIRNIYLGKSESGNPNFPIDNLVRHGLIVGASGSGKSAIGINIIESCLLNQIPVIAIDPKGDIGNLLYMPTEFTEEEIRSFHTGKREQQRYEGFEGKHYAELGLRTKDQWEAWKIPLYLGGNILSTTDIRLYTPGAEHGMPLGLFGNQQKGGKEGLDRLNEASAMAQSLMGILGLKSSPTGDEKVLLERAIWEIWEAGEEASPDRIATMLDDSDELLKTEVGRLKKRLYSLAHSFTFYKWRQKPTLNIQNLLWSGSNIPCCSILNIVHLQPEEQQFFLGVMLSKLITWMKQQPASNRLRALLYIDEASGLIPSVQNPVTKSLLMSLVKTARAFGLGVVFATQNPGDIDYKALTNVGTWITGLLKTERDRKKVSEAMSLADKKIISELGKREFIYHDTFSGGEEIRFKSRQTLCYMKGPMDQKEIERVTYWRKNLDRYLGEDGAKVDLETATQEEIEWYLNEWYKVRHFNPSKNKLIKQRMVQNLAWQLYEYKEYEKETIS